MAAKKSPGFKAIAKALPSRHPLPGAPSKKMAAVSNTTAVPQPKPARAMRPGLAFPARGASAANC